MKNIFYSICLAVLCLLPSQVFAEVETTLSIEDFSIKKGETKEMVIDLNNPDLSVWQMQFELSLPEGLSVAKETSGAYVMSKTDRAATHKLAANQSDGLTTVLLYTAGESAVTGKSGALIKMNIVASSDFKSGTISLGNIKVTNVENTLFSLSKAELAVGPKSVQVTVKDASRKYGEDNPSFTFTVVPESIDMTGKLAFTCDATAKSPVGEYAITAASTSDDYVVTCVPGKLTVTPASLKVTAKDATRVYGEENPKLAFTYEGFVNGEDETVVTTKPEATTKATKTSPVGEYAITVSGGSAANYAISDYVSGKLTVTKAPLTIKADDASRVYGAANPEFTYSLGGLVNDDTDAVLTMKPVLSTTATETSDADTYTISVEGGAAANYELIYAEGVLTVTKAPLKVIAKDLTCTYGSEAVYELSYEGFVNDDTEAAITTAPTVVSEITSSSPVGTYDITLSGGEAANYEFTEYVGATLTITPASLKVTAGDAERAYGSDNPLFDLVFEGFVNDENKSVLTEMPVASTEATVTSPVGDYDIVVSGGAAENYTIDEYVPGRLTVAKAVLTVQVASASRIYGGSNPEFSYEISGFANDETEDVITSMPVLTTEATKETPVGYYSISAIGGEAANYEFSSLDGTLEIYKAPLKATVNDATRTYGGEAVYTFTYEGFVNGDTKDAVAVEPTVTSTAMADSPIGTYDITISGGVAENYEFTEYAGAKLTITKAPLKVIANDVKWHIGDEWPALTLTYDHFVLGENENVLTQKPEAVTTATKDSPEGTYDITVTEGKAANYELSYVAGHLTILPPRVTFVETGVTYEVESEEEKTVTFSGVTSESGATPETAIEIPSSVTYEGSTYEVTAIGSEAFKGNESLEEVTIPESVESIGAAAFSGCTSLKCLVVRSAVPIDLAAAGAEGSEDAVFSGVDIANCTLYVPDESVEAYKNAAVWRNFGEIKPISALGIGRQTSAATFDVYDMRGHKVRTAATSLKGLPKGLYIVGGKKVTK